MQGHDDSTPPRPKDLTGLIETPDSARQDDDRPADSLQAPAIEQFESLDELSANHWEPPVLPTMPAEEAPLESYGADPVLASESVSAVTAPAQTHDAIARIREFGEAEDTRSAGAPNPFSLLIEGELSADDRDKLLELLSRESMGVREVDLEPQLAAGRILIPRISEYAGVMIVQALRSSGARMRLGPSDEIYATDVTRESTAVIPGSARLESRPGRPISDEGHPAESLPLTPLASVPGLGVLVPMETLVASAALRTVAVDTNSSAEYADTVEALARELKYKAFRKGADAVTGFTVEISPLTSPAHYRLTVTALAVRAEAPPPPSGHDLPSV